MIKIKIKRIRLKKIKIKIEKYLRLKVIKFNANFYQIYLYFSDGSWNKQSSLQYSYNRGANCGLSVNNNRRLVNSSVYDGAKKASHQGNLQSECPGI